MEEDPGIAGPEQLIVRQIRAREAYWRSLGHTGLADLSDEAVAEIADLLADTPDYDAEADIDLWLTLAASIEHVAMDRQDTPPDVV